MKEFDTKEFADALGVSKRTVENWRSSRDGRLKPDRYDGQKAVYTEAQLADARALLAKSKPAPADAQDVTDTDAKIDSDAAQHADCDSGNSLDETADIEPVTATANVTADAQAATDTDADIETINGTEQAPVDSGNSPHDCEDEKSTLELTSPPPPITLDDRAERIRRLQVDVTHGIIEIGRELIAAKAQVPHGRWAEWLATKIKWTQRTAQYFMAIAERFGNTNANSFLSVVNVVQPPEKSIDAAGNQSEISADEQDSNPAETAPELKIGELIETVMKSNDVTNLRRLRNCIDARLDQLATED